MAVERITLAELTAELNRGADLVLLDVRRHDEFENGHLPGAVHVPLDELDEALEDLDPARDYVVYCAHGIRSVSAVAMMTAAGFGSVRNLAGGIEGRAGADGADHS